MPTSTTVLKVFISSPGDVAEERRQAVEAISEQSRRYQGRGLSFMPVLWENDVQSELGERAQEIINRRLDGYDIYIGLMGERFGTPTGRAEGGTEEEFNIAIDKLTAGKIARVSFFFKDVQLNSGDLNGPKAEQILRVNDFKSRVSKMGIYQNFRERSEFIRSLEAILVDEAEKFLATKSQGSVQHTSLAIADIVVNKDFISEFVKDCGNYVVAMGDQQVEIEDLWVPPEFVDRSSASHSRKFKYDRHSFENVIENIKGKKSGILYGIEKSGRSFTLVKIFRRLFDEGYLPILIKKGDLNSPDTTNIKKRLRRALIEQYQNLCVDIKIEEVQDKIVVLCDDVDEWSFDRKNLILTMNVVRHFSHAAIYTSNIFFVMHDLVKASNSSLIGDFFKFEFQAMGIKRRYELIERWCETVARPGENEDASNHSFEVRLRIIESVFKTNLVPRTPHIVLILLQAIANGQHDSLLKSSSIRYYKFLIDIGIMRNVPVDQADAAYTLLPEIAWLIYQQGGVGASLSSLLELGRTLEQERDVATDLFLSLVEQLCGTKMLELSNGEYKFKHSYAYFYFLGEHLANNVGEGWAIQCVDDLIETVFKRDSANTLKFLAFHKNDIGVSQKLLARLERATKDLPLFDLADKELQSVDSLITEAPKNIIHPERLAEAKRARLDALDVAEAEAHEEEGQPVATETDPVTTVFHEVFSLIEILGDTTKNYATRLKSDYKREIISTCFTSGMKMTRFILDDLANSLEQMYELVREHAERIDRKKTMEAKEREARHIIFNTLASFLAFMSHQITSSIADESLDLTTSKIFKDNEQLTHKYLSFLMKLEAKKEFPVDELRELMAQIQGKFLPLRALQMLVVRKIEMRPATEMKLMQRICDAASLELKPVLAHQSLRERN